MMAPRVKEETAMDRPFLSIIIPVYNAAAFLPDTLERIQKAGLSGTEILLIDDGSQDESVEICRGFSVKTDLSVRFFRQENQGPSAARNRGLDECRGECVAFLDADDVLDPEFFRRAVYAMRESGAELLATDFFRISREGCVLDRICQIEDSEEPITDPAYMQHFLSDGEVVWNVWRFLFRRDFLIKNELRFIENVNCAEDLEFMIRALTACERPAFLHAPYYSYRVYHADSLSRRLTAKRMNDLMRMLSLSADRLKKTEGETARQLENKLAKEYLLNLAILCEMPAAERAEALDACLRAESVLDGARSGVVKASAVFTRLVGLRVAAWLLLAAKKLKRAHRKRLIRCYNKRK